MRSIEVCYLCDAHIRNEKHYQVCKVKKEKLRLLEKEFVPIRRTEKGWWWGSKGPFPTKEKAEQVQRAAYSSGYGSTKKRGEQKK